MELIAHSWAWPEPGTKAWTTFRSRVEAVNTAMPWQSKADKLFWRGALLSQWRNDLVGISAANPEWCVSLTLA